jgi:hypothetical protein
MWFCVFFLQTNSALAVKSFENEVEHDLSLKKSLPLYLQHKIGNVTVTGWVQDRVRIKLKYRVLADTEVQANQAFDKLELITLETADRYELRVGHKQGVDLVSKMRDDLQNTVQVDLEIKAPLQSDITLILGDGKSLRIDTWHGGIVILGKNNSLHFTKLSLNKPISLNCSECDTDIRDSKLGGHLLLGSKVVVLNNVEASPSLSIDEANEEIRIENSRGTLEINSKSGRLSVARFQGNLNFQSVDGGADITGFQGNLNIQTQTGQVIVDADSIKNFLNIDTEKSDIQVSLPPQFEGGLDLMSLRGEVVVQFPYDLKRIPGADVYGPASPGRIDAQIGSSSSVNFHAYSKQGGVRLLRKVPR